MGAEDKILDKSWCGRKGGSVCRIDDDDNDEEGFRSLGRARFLNFSGFLDLLLLLLLLFEWCLVSRGFFAERFEIRF